MNKKIHKLLQQWFKTKEKQMALITTTGGPIPPQQMANTPIDPTTGNTITINGGTPIGGWGNLSTTTGPYTYTTTDTSSYITPTTRWSCPMPDDVLEKMLTLGMSKSKPILKEKINKAWADWCKDQQIDMSLFPVLLAFAVMSLAESTPEVMPKK